MTMFSNYCLATIRHKLWLLTQHFWKTWNPVLYSRYSNAPVQKQSLDEEVRPEIPDIHKVPSQLQLIQGVRRQNVLVDWLQQFSHSGHKALHLCRISRLISPCQSLARLPHLLQWTEQCWVPQTMCLGSEGQIKHPADEFGQTVTKPGWGGSICKEAACKEARPQSREALAQVMICCTLLKVTGS